MLSCENLKIKEIINRQICLNYDNEDSFFCSIRDILGMYDLPSIIELQNQIPTKISWKKLIRKEVGNFWLKRLQDEAANKSTLKYLAIKHLEIV